MKDWNPAVATQPDDYTDSLAGALHQAPVRIGRGLSEIPSATRREDWRPRTGSPEVTYEH